MAAPVKVHRWGPVVQFKDGRLLTRCLNAFCDMDLGYDAEDVPEAERQTAAELIRQMEPQADKAFPCPFKKTEVYDRVVMN